MGLAIGHRDPQRGGLIGARVGDGAWDWLAWIGLGAPCVAALQFGLRGRSPRRAEPR
jgi:hypothetical protein